VFPVLYDSFPKTPSVLEKYEKDLLGVEDLSSIFEVSKQTIYKAIREGKFGVPIQIGRAFKIPKVYVLHRYFSSC